MPSLDNRLLTPKEHFYIQQDTKVKNPEGCQFITPTESTGQQDRSWPNSEGAGRPSNHQARSWVGPGASASPRAVGVSQHHQVSGGIKHSGALSTKIVGLGSKCSSNVQTPNTRLFRVRGTCIALSVSSQSREDLKIQLNSCHTLCVIF